MENLHLKFKIGIKTILFHCFIFSLFISFLILNSKFLMLNSSVFAQESKMLLLVTSYKTRDHLDVLFAQSTQVLEYLEGKDVEQPIFLSIATDKQRQNLLLAGLNPRILDRDADISRYILLYHPSPNQTNKLEDQGEPIALSKHYTLLTLPYGKSFVNEGVAAEFFEIPFSDVIVTPFLRTKRAQELSPTFVQVTPSAVVLKPEFNLWFLLFSLYLIAYPITVALLYREMDKRKMFDTSYKKTVFLALATILFAIGFFILSNLAQATLFSSTNNQYDLEVKDIQFF